MSEMSLITKRYSDIVDFTSKVNKSVIVFKKKSILANDIARKKYPKLELSDTEVKGATEDLLKSLTDLQRLAADTEVTIKLAGLSENEALQDLIISSDADRKEIEEIVVLLKAGKPLTKTNFVMLDKIIAVLDSQRNILFRKLRTARG